MDNLDTGTQNVNGGDGGQQGGEPKFAGPEWMASLPDDLKASKSLGKFKDVENLARGYINAEQLVGRDKIPMPKTDAEFAEVYTKLGCPLDIAEYKVAYESDGISEDIKATLAEDLKAFLPMAKANGLNNKQANGIFSEYVKLMAASAKDAQEKKDAEFAAADKAIKAEFGETTEVKLELANRMITALGGEKVVNAIANSGLGRNPEFVKMMVKLGEAHAEQLGIDKTGNNSLMTPADLRAQIATLQAHPAYMDASHPEHKSVVDRVQQLFLRASQK